MERYIAAIHKKEIQSGMRKVVREYIFNKNSDLLRTYCDGKNYLPSFVLLKQIKEKLKFFVLHDTILGKLVNQSIKLSEKFYYNLINLNDKPSHIRGVISNNNHIEQLQKYGQDLLYTLVMIKQRLKIIKITLRIQNSKTQGKILKNQSKINHLVKYFTIILYYKISELQFIYPFLINIAYNLMILCMMSAISLIIYYTLFHLIHTAFLLLISLICNTLIVIASMIYSPIYNFDNKDIFGNNIAIHKHFIFVNNYVKRHLFD
ncbi:hypothetical protein [Rickettsia endosymbiont of Cardiosporidium cionae]|uniref:hypothetical protein n=1 Tax=Rickettsia endosymbiont of Cardiosporidium cionae TaxID=2777155 RepID=UPI001894D719|nr:hypothetical protein [Rickettsia endosymbiont of Cardiosporidium cionae]KAF8818665.1 hypothetical protein IHI24_000387 [Rickettsia endosymbiont of Cardiosporidium cionae]